MVAAAEQLIAGLNWADFETLVDVILARGGRRRGVSDLRDVV
jgi:hypothetical protein